MLAAMFSTKVALTAQALQTAMDILRACHDPALRTAHSANAKDSADQSNDLNTTTKEEP
jgi:hypothetical protein